MRKKLFTILLSAVVCCLAAATALAQAKFVEFPIAVGRDSTFSTGAVYGNTTGLVAILGDTLSQYNVTAQLVYPPDSLIGNRISVGRAGVFPGGVVVVFDGANYLLAWKENTGDINGQFINETGNLVGSYFTIATNTSTEGPWSGGMAFNDTTYFGVFAKADTHLYGQRISKSGVLIGGQIQISNNHARDISLAYDGTNYLAAWVEVISDIDKDIYGQFINKSGSLVGTNFLIDGGPNYSDNPTALACDGARYLLAYHETPDTNTKWTLMGRFITTSGTVEESIVICDSTKDPGFPSISFDGDHYLTTWTQSIDLSLMGQFWTPAGLPVDAPFTIFNSVGGKIPFGGCGFGGGWFLAVGSMVDFSFTDGDVYGAFIPKYTGVAGNPVDPVNVSSFKLGQNAPNPFKQSTTINYQLTKPGLVNLTVYNTAGQLVKTLVNDYRQPGSYTVNWDCQGNDKRKVANGVFLVRMESEGRAVTNKMVVVR